MNNATKRILASSPETPSDMLEVLSTDPDNVTCALVALNLNTPMSVIHKMLAACISKEDDTVPDGEVVDEPSMLQAEVESSIAWILFRKQADGTLLFAGFTDNELGFTVENDPDGLLGYAMIEKDPDLVLMQIESAEKIPPIHMAYTVKKT
jgi:hypothetical protein